MPALDAPTFDLQCHSTRSDGVLEPADVVERAARAGVELLALTDHDTVDGVDEALAAASVLGIRLVPAAELSAVHHSFEDLHIVGYLLDHTHVRLLTALERFRADRAERAFAMAETLRELGWAVDADALAARRAQGLPIGRPHLAIAAFEHPANAERLEREGYETFSDLLEAYLIPGKPAYRPRTEPNVYEAISLIHAAGGVAVWAHPFWDMSSTPSVLAALDNFAAHGLDGVEAFYPFHDADRAHALADRAAELGLLTTGSADFHGPEHSHFSEFRAFDLYGRVPNLGPIGSPAP